jgi:hypothetical protein
MPTVLDAIGVAPVDGPQGAPLAPLAQGVGRGWARPSYASQYEYAHAMRIGRWKLRIGPRGTPLVGDMVADPGETANAGPSHPIERRMLTDNLGLFLAIRTQWRKAVWGVVSNVTAAGARALDEISTSEPRRRREVGRLSDEDSSDDSREGSPRATPEAAREGSPEASR